MVNVKGPNEFEIEMSNVRLIDILEQFDDRVLWIDFLDRDVVFENRKLKREARKTKYEPDPLDFSYKDQTIYYRGSRYLQIVVGYRKISSS